MWLQRHLAAARRVSASISIQAPLNRSVSPASHGAGVGSCGDQVMGLFPPLSNPGPDPHRGHLNSV